jgi:hypothetical protein
MPEFTQRISSNGHRKADAPEPMDTIPLTPPDAGPIARSDSIGEFYIEKQAAQGVEEQREAYEAQAERESAAAKKNAAELAHRAGMAESAGDRRDALAAGECKRFEARLAVLGQHARRAVHSALVYWIVRALIVLGDLAGASGAILVLGEEPFNAFAQAAGVAVSAVVIGSIGATLRHWVMARARRKPLEDLTDEEKACASFFAGPDHLAMATKILFMVFVAGVAAIVTGVFTLRDAAEGEGAAIAFGCFAFAVCLASFFNSYEYACEVSDFLEAAGRRLKLFEKDAAKAGGDRTIANYNGAVAEVYSIHARNNAESAAAGRGLLGEMYGEFLDRPELYGHGIAAVTSDKVAGDKSTEQGS